MRKPPEIAPALLRYFGRPEDGSVGDVLEQFQSGKSRAWYWRQVASIVCAAVFREIRVRPVAIVLCLFVGLIVAWEIPTTVFRLTIDPAFRWYSRRYFAHGGLPPLPLGHFFWVVNFGMAVLAYTSGGFVGVRFYRGYRPLMVLMFAVVVACQQATSIVLFSITFDATVMPAHYVVQTLPPQNMALLMAVPPIAALIGGMLGTRFLTKHPA